MRLSNPPAFRPWLMQAALCLVLVASLGLAAWVARRQTRALRVELSETSMIDGLTIKWPQNWTLRRDEDGLLLQEMRKSSASPRKLRIRYARSSIFMSPLEYLVRCGELQAHEASALMEASSGPAIMPNSMNCARYQRTARRIWLPLKRGSVSERALHR